MALRLLNPLKSIQFLRSSRSFRHRSLNKSDIPKIFRLDSLDHSLESEETEKISHLPPQILLFGRGHKERVNIKKKIQIKYWARDLKKNDLVLTMISMLGLILAIIYYEDSYAVEADKNRELSYSRGDILKLSIFLSSLYLIPLLMRHSILTYKIDRENEFCFETFIPLYWKSVHFKKLIIELFINMVVPLPFFDIDLEFEQLSGKLIVSLDAVLISIMMLRTYNIFRAIKYYAHWNSESAQSHCKFHDCRASELFVLKCFLKEKPYLCLVFILTFSVIAFAIVIRIYERPYTEYNDSEKQNYGNLFNAMWMVVMAMTTIGYGDFFPRTHIGRFLGILACLWGVFLISLTVYTLTNSIEFNKSQLKSFQYLKKAFARENAQEEARMVAKVTLMLNYYKLSGSRDMVIQTKNALFEHLKMFKKYINLSKHNDMTDEDLLLAINDKINRHTNLMKDRIQQANELYLQVVAFQESQIETREALSDIIKSARDLRDHAHSQFIYNVFS